MAEVKVSASESDPVTVGRAIVAAIKAHDRKKHQHQFWKTYRAGRLWRNQYAMGRQAIPTGAACRCGARTSEADHDRWLATARHHRMSFNEWASREVAG